MTASPTHDTAASTKSPKADPRHQDPNPSINDEAAEDRLHALRHYLLRNIRYHTRRAALFAQWHKLTAFVGVFFGSTAAMSFLFSDTPTAASVMAAIVALFSAIDLVVGTAAKEAQHMELRRRWIALQKRFEVEGLTSDIQQTLRSIEMDEPAELSVVEMQAHNDATLALLGDDGRKELLQIPLKKRIIGQFMNIDTSSITKAPTPDGAPAATSS